MSHNTCELVALLLWSNHRVLDCPTLGEVVVVDNGSTDGTPNLLDGAAQAGLCTLLTNHDNRYHGPGLNQALSYLARKAAVTGAHPRWVWILDSDCVVARPDALAAASGAAGQTGASLVGEHQWDPWPSTERFGSHCLLLDPAATWREPIPPFDDGGDPTFSFLDSSAGLGLVSTDVPFLADGSVIHRARGTLAAVFAQQERTNHL